MSRLLLLALLPSVLLLAGACQTTKAKAPPAAPDGPTRVLEVPDSGSFDADELRAVIQEEIELFQAEGSKPNVDDAAWALERHLQGLGFPLAQVRYEYERSEGGDVRAKLLIEEGPRTFLDRITFVGVAGVDPKVLLQSFGERRSLLGQKRWFVESEVRSKLVDIGRFYRTQGFQEAEIAEPLLEYHDNGERVNLTITVKEGPRFLVREIGFAGLPVDDADQRKAALEALTADVIGTPLAPRTPYTLRSRIEGDYARRGYPDAQVEFEVVRDDSDGDAVILFRVEEGLQVRIAAIRVRGNKKSRESYIRARVVLKTGQVYDVDDVQKTFSALYKSRLFRKIDIKLEGDGPVRDLVVEVEELPSLEAWIEPGWGSYELFRVAGGIRERNFLGTGRALSLEGSAAVNAQQLILSLANPFFLGSPYSITYSLFGNRRTEPFITSEVGAGIDLSRSWNDLWSSSLGYQFRFTDLEGGSLDDPTDISSFTFTTTRDSRDGIFLPTKGALNRASVEWGAPEIGSQLDFLRLRYTQSLFHPLSASTVLGFSLRGGMIAPLNDTDTIPRQERFLNGGENTVRSFKEGDLGPEFGGDPQGGEAFSVTTLELRQRVTRGFDGALFVDAGNLEQEARDAFDFRGLRYAVGFGIRYLLPIGPLRLDFAWNPDPNLDEEGFQIHFSVGMPF